MTNTANSPDAVTTLKEQNAKLLAAVKSLAFALNGCRLIMRDKEARDMTLELVNKAKALCAEAEASHA